MANLYLDENTTVRLLAPLAALGNDAVSANHLGFKGRSDADQLLIATGLGRVLVTYDREDFQVLHEAWLLWSRAWGVPRMHAGIIVLHPAKSVTIEEIAHALHAGLASESEPLFNRMIAWKRHIGWHEMPARFPLTSP